MSFISVLGWILFVFLLGFFLGLGFGGVVTRKQIEKEQKSESDRKVAEK